MIIDSLYTFMKNIMKFFDTQLYKKNLYIIIELSKQLCDLNNSYIR